ncbi:DUF1572 family protein [Sphingobacterium thalpophilum]|uniref:DUF1572 family protein n=1 Tax=Sphingobacterium thalpophilum TaxID=259 RepID=UPI003C709410
MDNFLASSLKQFRDFKSLGDRTFSQLNDEQLFWQFNASSNSVAHIVKHLHGNMLSRWTDFLHSDGEKAGRNRDMEFENTDMSRQELLGLWERGWECLFEALEALSTQDLSKTILIRGEEHTVLEAVHRQLAHYPYHVGQIVYIGKMCLDEQWASLSIPKGRSENYNQEKFAQKKR